MVWTAIALATAWLQPGAGQEGAPLEVGAAVEGILPAQAGGRIAHALLSDQTGDATLCLRSFDFDARLEVRDASGQLLAEATDGGLGQDARLALPLSVGPGCRVLVGSDDGRGGEYRLELLAGEPPPCSEVGVMRAQIEYWETAGRRAREHGDVRRTLTSLRLAGHHAERLGSLSFALDRYREALNLAAENGNEGEARYVCGLAGSILLDLGNYEEALAFLGASLDALDRADNAPLRAFLLYRLGELHDAKHETAEAESVYSSLLEYARRGRLPAHEARALARLGYASAKRDRREVAVALHRASLDIAAGLSPEEQGLAHYFFGQSLLLMGMLDGARAELACAADMAGRRTQVSALHTLGAIERRLGHYDQALDLLEEAGRRCEETGHELWLPATLVELAVLSRGVADYGRSEALLERALALTQAPWLARQRIDVLSELALLRGERDAQEERRKLLEDAVELASSAGYAEEEARCRLNLGACHHDAGNLDRAQAEYSAALRTAAQCGSTSLMAIAEANISSVDLSQGRHVEALQRGENAYRALSALGLRLESLYALETVAQAAIAQNDTERAAVAVELARRTLNEVGSDLGASQESGFRSREAWWAAPLDQDMMLLKIAGADSPDERAEAMRTGFRRAGEWKGRALHAGLAARVAPHLRRVENVEEILREQLGSTTMLIEYVGSSDRLLAYTLHRGHLGLLDLGSREDIEARVLAYVREILSPDSSVASEALARTGQRLYADLLLPALESTPDVEKLVIVPTTSLAALPFEVLPIQVVGHGEGGTSDRDNTTYVLDRFVVAYGPSSPVLVQLAAAPPSPILRRVLILADPDYERDLSGGGRAFDRLPGTRAEAAALVDILGAGKDALDALPWERNVLLETSELTLCLGAEATPARLRTAAGYSILHCAAHGVVDMADPRQTGIALSTGFLSVTDVLGLELAADLVVLSACDTAQGRVQRGEGVQSMAYAFLGAGARSVVANLWKVDDEATATLMRRFYEALWRDGLPPAEALTAAKRSFRRAAPTLLASGDRGVPVVGPLTKDRSGAHPFFWAAHIYVGLP